MASASGAAVRGLTVGSLRLVDRRSFLKGSVGLAAAGAFARLDLGVAGAAPGPPPAPVAPASLAPTAWPPTPGAYTGLVADWVVAENALPGSDGWRIGGPEPAGTVAANRDGPVTPGIEGYLDATSATLGQRIAFHVSSASPTYTIEAYRMGWYQGQGGRLVWQSDQLPGWRQRAPRVDEETNLAEAHWDTTYEITLHAPPFVPGCYLFRLTGADGASRLVPLTIRDDTSHARFVVINPVADWQAYNEWGGASLYYGRGAGEGSRNFGNRARVVSYDRPYDWGLGAADFIGADLPLIMRMEEAGLDVTYATSIDVHDSPERLKRHAAVLSTAHDEYWTMQMRQGVEGARDAGVNLVFFGANAMFRQVRLEDSPQGPFRHQVCYKSSSEDPLRQEAPDFTTVNWREAPVSRPECSLIGVQYDGLGWADLVVTNPEGWIWADTGIERGQTFPRVVGPEFDRISSASPENVEIMARSPIEEVSGRESHADMTYYSAPSGAGVFATGTIAWIDKLTPGDGTLAPREPQLYHATMNVLRAFGAGPAGGVHASTPNGR